MAFLDETGLTYFWSKVKGNINNTVSNHANNKSNPHGVTKAQVGLGNVDNVSRASILQSVYPVGAIYMSISSTSPASLFGGTWEEITGRFLLAHDESHPAASTGGEYQHVLTLTELPRYVWHSNEAVQLNGLKAKVDAGSFYGMLTQGDNFDKPHNNTPPYLAVYMWKRIA